MEAKEYSKKIIPLLEEVRNKLKEVRAEVLSDRDKPGFGFHDLLPGDFLRTQAHHELYNIIQDTTKIYDAICYDLAGHKRSLTYRVRKALSLYNQWRINGTKKSTVCNAGPTT